MSRAKWIALIVLLCLIGGAGAFRSWQISGYHAQRYAEGLAAEEAGDWDRAHDIWVELTGYRDSRSRREVASCQGALLAAKELLDAERYEQAAARLATWQDARLTPGSELHKRVIHLVSEAEAKQREEQARQTREQARTSQVAGNAAYQRKDWAAAIASYHRATQLDPSLSDEVAEELKRARAGFARQEEEKQAAAARQDEATQAIATRQRVTVKPAKARVGPVGAYLDRLMQTPNISNYIDQIWQPDPSLPLVYVTFKSNIPDYQMEKMVRAITEGVQKTTDRGAARVVGQVRGITVVEGKYNIWNGSIEVKTLR